MIVCESGPQAFLLQLDVFLFLPYCVTLGLLMFAGWDEGIKKV